MKDEWTVDDFDWEYDLGRAEILLETLRKKLIEALDKYSHSGGDVCYHDMYKAINKLFGVDTNG